MFLGILIRVRKLFARVNENRTLIALREKCLYLKFFWSLISRIRNEHRHLLCKPLYSVGMPGGNTDKKNSEDGHFLRSVVHRKIIKSVIDHSDCYQFNVFPAFGA